ncbi:MAG: hypothetical protein ACK5IJ_05970 [Mangrovibacterium sp.]
MKQLLFLLSLQLGILMPFTMHAQIAYYPITISEKGIFNQKVYNRCDVEMTPDQVLKLLAKDAQMQELVLPMAKIRIVERLCFASGVLLCSLPLVDALQGHSNPNWNLAYLGASALAVSIPLRCAFNKKLFQAVGFYNRGYREAPIAELKMQLSPHAFQLVMQF